MPAINIEAIKTLPIKTTKHEVPEWGGYICIRKLSVAQVDEVSGTYKKEDGNWIDSMLATIIAASVNDEGKPMFTEEHTEFLKEQDGDVMQGIYKAILQFNGMDKTEEEGEAVKP